MICAIMIPIGRLVPLFIISYILIFVESLGVIWRIFHVILFILRWYFPTNCAFSNLSCSSTSLKIFPQLQEILKAGCLVGGLAPFGRRCPLRVCWACRITRPLRGFLHFLSISNQLTNLGWRRCRRAGELAAPPKCRCSSIGSLFPRMAGRSYHYWSAHKSVFSLLHLRLPGLLEGRSRADHRFLLGLRRGIYRPFSVPSAPFDRHPSRRKGWNLARSLAFSPLPSLYPGPEFGEFRIFKTQRGPAFMALSNTMCC